MKLIASLTLAATLAASTAFAGAVEYTAPAAPTMIEEPQGSMGSSGFWIIPAVILVVCIVLCFPDDEEENPNDEITPGDDLPPDEPVLIEEVSTT